MSPKPLRSTYTRLAITLAAGSLIALAGATPALADDDWDPGSGDSREWDNGRDDGQEWDPGRGDGDGRDWEEDGRDEGRDEGRDDDGRDWENGRGDNRDNDPRRYKGRISARGGLALRTAPNRGSRVLRVARYGEIVHIFCKTSGQSVDGNRLWYQLTDGTWAWGAARYIDNIGPAPRWC
ncbi:SH3 domain-containing protein [Streptomyces sp. NBC_00243]|uniref:SH3 domain-containing protein n=1 Tax=Streptomyces sp. NBC_00243 TaxID=2975688 RepID=UPI002DDC3F55|nr:SH3 domain-containing protein [Streptomyces sp. NBC_00243]WRZ19774.1 SH3 domain-containing protein [Streptomyces sp. NBC_00243]